MNIYYRYTQEPNKHKLNFHQFSEIFLPFDAHHSDEIQSRIPKYTKSFPTDKTKVFKESTNNCIIQLIATLVRCELRLKKIREEANEKCSDVTKCFQLLAKQGNLLRLQSQRSMLKNSCQQHNKSFNHFKQDSIKCTCKDKFNHEDHDTYITHENLLKQMQQFGMNVDQDDISLLVILYDRSKNGKISVHDFLKELLDID